ncbi:hypothetical protein ABW19_dt0207909 [Dactylella cylindrospora]|nr:hypothetical protein ABW19_dt0207909 [Dactylella cylindrospora]
MASENDSAHKGVAYKGPSKLSYALSVGFATGSCGAFVGAVVATLRNHPRKGVFIAGTALSTFILGSGFYGI